MLIYNVLKNIKDFANKHVVIEEIWVLNGDMEEKRETFYFVTEGKLSSHLPDLITKLELEIMKKNNYNIHILEWSCGRNNVKDSPIIQGIKIYDNRLDSNI